MSAHTQGPWEAALETGRALFKTVEYSYPSSPNAVSLLGCKVGNSNGCYTVEFTDGHNPPFVAIRRGFADSEEGRAEAVAAANTLPEAWSPLHLRHHPEDKQQTPIDGQTGCGRVAGLEAR